MIDFRYHLVSLIAVFLALTLGIVVGTTALNGGIVDALRASNSKVIRDKRGLEADVRRLRGQVTAEEGFVTAVAPGLLRNSLVGQRVVVVGTPEAPGDAMREIGSLVQQAGGTWTGTVRLRPALLDPERAGALDDLVARVLPAGVHLPDDSDPAGRAAVELSAALVARTPTGGVSQDDAAQILGAFGEADLIDVTAPEPPAADAAGRATMAVLVCGIENAAAEAAEARGRAVLALARALDDRSAGAVLAAPTDAATRSSVLGTLREDASSEVSTVDGVETAAGRVTVILALREQLADAAGSYGRGAGAKAVVPTPSPT